MANITKALVEGVRIPSYGQIFVRDNQLKGFALRVTDNGVKSFIWEGRVKGRVRRITLGQFPALTVLDARKAALETKTAIVRGEDPAHERAEIRAERTFGDLSDAYLERHAKQRKRSWREDAAVLKNHIPSAWRHRKLSDISREDVIQLRDAVARKENPRVKDKEQRKRGMPYAANHLLRLLRTMFNLARDWGMLAGDNPATRIKLLSETKRDRFLSPDELARVNTALAQEPNEYWRAYFALSLMLGTRKGELLVLKWSDIDFRQKTLRISQTKAGRPHILPLPAPAISILESLPSRHMSDWVFPSAESKTGHLASPKHAWERIRKAARVPDVRVHDLRRTLGSWLAASGYSLPLIGRALNHTEVSTTAIYARLNLDPVREALERNAALMLAAGTPKSKAVEHAEPTTPSAELDTIAARSGSPQEGHSGWIELSREDLYEKVWSKPAANLAGEFGITDRGLGKICARFQIPVPPRGYWQKLAAGQRIRKTPLPWLKTKVPRAIQIRRMSIASAAAVKQIPNIATGSYGNDRRATSLGDCRAPRSELLRRPGSRCGQHRRHFVGSWRAAVSLSLLFVFVIFVLVRRALLSSSADIILDPGRAFAKVEEIYNLASTNGGTLIATHVRPSLFSPQHDVAIKYLATVREDLEYRRLLIFEDKDQEDAWATEFLTQLDSRIRRSLYVLLQPPLLPSSTWSVMTLANLLLYHKDQYYLSLIGFGEMGQRSFSITFSSRPAYQVLGAFFDSLVSDASVTALSSLEAYASARHNYYVAPNLRSVLATFIKGATHNENVLHEGAFGKHALTLNQVRRFAPRQEHESDYVWPLRSFSSLLQHPSGAGDPG